MKGMTDCLPDVINSHGSTALCWSQDHITAATNEFALDSPEASQSQSSLDLGVELSRMQR